MRIRRNIIAPLILTIGAVGSLVAVPAVTALTAVTPATTAVATGITRPPIRLHGVNIAPGQPPAVDSPIVCGLLAFAGNGGKFAGKTENFLSGRSPVPFDWGTSRPFPSPQDRQPSDARESRY